MTYINRGCDDNLFITPPVPLQYVKDYSIVVVQDSEVVATLPPENTEVRNGVIRAHLNEALTSRLSPHRVAVYMEYTDLEDTKHRSEARTIAVR